MGVVNVHTRWLPVSTAEAGALIDSLAGSDDRLWPTGEWPPMEFDRPLGVGAVGGHGPVRYTVQHYVPGEWVRFGFTGPRGFDGFHEFTVHPGPDGTIALRHTLAIQPTGPARLTWPFAFRWLHDACLEDSLDKAERDLTGTVARPTRWSWYVKLLHAISERVFRN